MYFILTLDLSPKRNYPYTKTSVQDLLVQKNDPINNQVSCY